MSGWEKTPAPLPQLAPTEPHPLDRYLPAQAWDALARRVGFRQRTPRKISPGGFLRACGGLAFCAHPSLELLAARLGLDGPQTVSKQAVAKRGAAAGGDLLRHGLFTVLAALARFAPAQRQGLFQHFGRVLIQDSKRHDRANYAEQLHS